MVVIIFAIACCIKKLNTVNMFSRHLLKYGVRHFEHLNNLPTTEVLFAICKFLGGLFSAFVVPYLWVAAFIFDNA